MIHLRRGARTFALSLRSLLAADAGQSMPEYGLVSALFGLVSIAALLVVASTSSTQLTGTQSRVQNAAISVPAR